MLVVLQLLLLKCVSSVIVIMYYCNIILATNKFLRVKSIWLNSNRESFILNIQTIGHSVLAIPRDSQDSLLCQMLLFSRPQSFFCYFRYNVIVLYWTSRLAVAGWGEWTWGRTNSPWRAELTLNLFLNKTSPGVTVAPRCFFLYFPKSKMECSLAINSSSTCWHYGGESSPCC